MITPNKIHIKGEEITDEDIALEIKKTGLILKRARLKLGLPVKLDDEDIKENNNAKKTQKTE